MNNREMSVNSEVIWRPVAGFEGEYEVSNFGEVRRIGRRNLKMALVDGKGRPYFTVCLSKDGRRSSKQVSVLAARAFLEPPRDPRLTAVGHKDEDLLNNDADNLYWTTPGELRSEGRRRMARVKSALRKVIGDWKRYYRYLSYVDWSRPFDDFHDRIDGCSLGKEAKCNNCCLNNRPYRCLHEQLAVEDAMASGDRDKALSMVSSMIGRMEDGLAKLERRTGKPPSRTVSPESRHTARASRTGGGPS